MLRKIFIGSHSDQSEWVAAHYLMTFSSPGRESRGFGFVQFTQLNAAQKAVAAMNAQEILGELLTRFSLSWFTWGTSKLQVQAHNRQCWLWLLCTMWLSGLWLELGALADPSLSHDNYWHWCWSWFYQCKRRKPGSVRMLWVKYPSWSDALNTFMGE